MFRIQDPKALIKEMDNEKKAKTSLKKFYKSHNHKQGNLLIWVIIVKNRIQF
jgi:hypothetical protein